jgi:hypothetical protein
MESGSSCGDVVPAVHAVAPPAEKRSRKPLVQEHCSSSGNAGPSPPAAKRFRKDKSQLPKCPVLDVVRSPPAVKRTHKAKVRGQTSVNVAPDLPIVKVSWQPKGWSFGPKQWSHMN